MTKTIALTALTACFAAGITLKSLAEDKKPEMTIKQVMKEKMKGDNCDIKLAIKGELPKEKVTTLLAAVKNLGGQKPPKGDETAWKEKCAALVSALEKLDKGEAGAADAVKTAANCKACHEAHKGK